MGFDDAGVFGLLFFLCVCVCVVVLVVVFALSF